jgi:TDG/mug DNA glycosylase family protein
MPSVKSLEFEMYYGHPQNAFWRVLERVLGIPVDLARDERFAAVRAAGLAIWDVVESARRPGSADAAIRDERPNDVPGLLLRMPACDRVLLNGRKAEQLYERHLAARVVETLAVHGRTAEVVGLPSTSPANASIPFETKVARWQDALRRG